MSATLRHLQQYIVETKTRKQLKMEKKIILLILLYIICTQMQNLTRVIVCNMVLIRIRKKQQF